MKKMSVIIFVIAAISCSVAFGHPIFLPSDVAVIKSGKVFKVIYKGRSNVPVKLIISDSEGSELFKEKIICAGGFIRPYNFSQLPEGSYRLRVVDNKGEYFEEIYYEAEGNDSREADQPLIARIAKLKCDGNKYIVVVPNQAQKKEFAVNIYDQNEMLVFSERHSVKQDFAKVYNLKNLNGATIKLLTESGKEILSKTAE